MDLAWANSTYLPWIEAEMRAVIGSGNRQLLGHYGMMEYHLGWADASFSPTSAPSGKRIRPLLCVLACGAAGGDPRTALPAAAGLELLHNFSLIHDDIEDNSPIGGTGPQCGLCSACPRRAIRETACSA
jgi:geranylgeranyl diphosphate synthase type I